MSEVDLGSWTEQRRKASMSRHHCEPPESGGRPHITREEMVAAGISCFLVIGGVAWIWPEQLS